MTRQLQNQAAPEPPLPKFASAVAPRTCSCGSHSHGARQCARCARAAPRGWAFGGTQASEGAPNATAEPARSEQEAGRSDFTSVPVRGAPAGLHGFLNLGFGVATPITDQSIKLLQGRVEPSSDSDLPTRSEAPGGPAAPPPAPSGPAPGAPPAAPPSPPACTMTSRTVLHAPGGTADARRTVGVSESVVFSVGAVANWVTTGGTPGPAGAATFTWVAPETAGSTTITATVPTTGATCNATIDTILPGAPAMTKLSEDGFPAGTSGAGMILHADFLPNTVSFRASEWLEVAGPASNVTGYFLALQAGGTDLSHHPNPNFVAISATTSDHAAGSGFPAPWSAGGFDWVIPNRVRRIGSTTAGTLIPSSTQSFRIAANGAVTVSKGGASVSRAP